MRKFVYVPVKEVKEERAYCSDMMNQLKQHLLNEGWDADFDLIGSGAKGLVTRIDGQGFDLDYNLVINDPCDDFDGLKFKNQVMQFLNEIKSNKFHDSFKNCEDSKSVITSKFVVEGELKFHFDVAILAKNKNADFCKLIHDKGKGSYSWEQIPDSRVVYAKFDTLKRDGHFQDIRDTYLVKKNMYLTRNDSEHPSFVVFVETVNEVYTQHYKPKDEIRIVSTAMEIAPLAKINF